MEQLKSHFLHEFTSHAFGEFLRKHPNGVVIFCLGSIEQHGKHLPLGTDFISVKDRALRIAQRTNSVVCYTTLAGYSPQHLDFAGTISLRQETLSNIIYDTVLSLIRHSVKRILILNTHATNAPIIESTILKIKEQYTISIAFTRSYPSSLVKIFSTRKYKELDIHAGKSETSIMRAISPEFVDEKYIHEERLRHTPSILKKIMEEEKPDDVNKFLFDTLLPARSKEISEDGVYGISDLNTSDPKDYLNNISRLIDFYVDFIERWKKIEL